MTTNQQPATPPVKIAFVIDNQVVDVLHTDDRLGAIFLSDPVTVDVSDLFYSNNMVLPGDTYDSETKTFSRVLEPTTPTE
jgi:hypothetical protein